MYCQKVVNMFCFQDFDKNVPLSKCLMNSIFFHRIAAAHTQMNEKDRLKQEQLDIKCLQLLRGIIHNEIVKLPDDWELNLSANKK